ncbi:g294 [Coccomyxa elongata]
MSGKAEQWVLEFLLDRDSLSETVVRELYEHLGMGADALSKTIQVRLLLRVLREHAASITDATLNALNCLAANSNDNRADYSPFADLSKLLPSLDLYLQVKTELVLQSLRGGSLETLILSGNPKSLLDRYFPPQQDALQNAPESHRRQELAINLSTPHGAQTLLEKYPPEHVEGAMLKYVAEGRAAMGQPILKVMEAQYAQGLLHPTIAMAHPQGAFGNVSQGPKKRQRHSATSNNAEVAAATTIADLQAASKGLQNKGGPDPLTAAMQAAGGQGSFAAALNAVDHGAGPSMSPGMPDAAGRTVGWDSPDPNQVTPGPNMAGMLGPNGEPLTDGSMGKSPNKNRTGGGKRRRNGRWNEHETNTLIELVRQLGKGKWKKILEEGAAAFNNRSQVDLKDKWRNLERQGVVSASDGVLAANGGVMTPEQQQVQAQAAQQAQQQQPMMDGAAMMAGHDGVPMLAVQDPAAAAAAMAAAQAQAQQAMAQPEQAHEQIMHHVEGGMPAQM